MVALAGVGLFAAIQFGILGMAVAYGLVLHREEERRRLVRNLCSLLNEGGFRRPEKENWKRAA